MATERITHREQAIKDIGRILGLKTCKVYGVKPWAITRFRLSLISVQKVFNYIKIGLINNLKTYFIARMQAVHLFGRSPIILTTYRQIKFENKNYKTRSPVH